MFSSRAKIIVAVLLIAFSVAFRLLPHPANFAPVAAAAMITAVYLGGGWAVVVPLAVMFFSDLFIGFYDWPIMAAVYGSFGLIGLLNLLNRRRDFVTVIYRSVFASLFFFMVTNWAVWQFGISYSHGLDGLFQSYLMAVPFFRNTLLGDIAFGLSFAAVAETVLAARTHLIARAESRI
ncbi:MAG: DUF6580 family putative transport protein [Patescibacteria group bacterium]|jgi:hypothetical protein